MTAASEPIEYTAMRPHDYDAVRALWESAEGVGLDASDERKPIERFLARNADLSLVARDKDATVGAVLCGHEGRRGYLSHLAVAATHQRRGIGRELVRRCLQSLADVGVLRCNVRLFIHNADGARFWQSIGWRRRDELEVWACDTQ